MGNRALGRALIDVEESVGRIDAVRQTVIAAPDIDTDIFARHIAPRIVHEDRRITLNASSRDRAPNVAQQLHRHPRVGDAGASVLVYPDVDTVDATNFNTSFLDHD